MRREPAKGHGCRACRECLIRDISELFAVHRVGILCSPSLNVKLIDPAADLFVWRKGDRDIPVLDLGILLQDVEHRHDLGDTRFVVRTKQRSPVGRDNVVADHVLEIRILGDRDDLRLVVWQNNIPALVILVNDRVDVRTRNGRRRVHVRDKADRRHLRIVRQVSRQKCVNDAPLADPNIEQ